MGKTITLDLNGKTIDRGLTAATAWGSVIRIEGGSLTIMDSSTADVNSQGKITGAYNYGGGAVDVMRSYGNNVGFLTMTGGIITGNKAVGAESGTGGGAGGVYLANDSGGFTMTGGRIFGNTVTSAASAGGVLCAGAGKLTVGVTAEISGNQKTVASVTTDSNVYLSNNATIACSGLTPLTMGASVGVTTQQAADSLGVAITDSNSADYSGFFNYDLVDSSNCYALASAVNIGVYGEQAVKLMTEVMTVDLDGAGEDSTPKKYNTFAQGWNEAVGASNTIVTLNANWTAKSRNGSTSFGSGAGFERGGAISVPAGKIITLDLNDKTINRALTQGIANGNVVTVAGSLTVKDESSTDVAQQGKITGGWNSTAGSQSGGGILVNGIGATLCLEGGSITGNKCIGWGGGVQINERSYFTMNGGKITGNVTNYRNTAATDGFDNCGGVYARGTFIMAGGEIFGNFVCGDGTGNKGGGVFFYNTLTVGGTAVIKDNQSGCTFDNGTISGGITDNVYVRSDKTLTLGTFSSSSSVTPSIGVTTEDAPTKDSPVTITT